MPEHTAPHPDLAAWAMGRLDPDEALAFQAHLESCATCRREADEVAGVPRLLEQAAPPFEVPSGLEERVFAALDSDAPARPAPRRRRLPRLPRLAWAAAAAAAAAVALVVVVIAGSGAPEVQRVALRSTTGASVDVSAAVRVTPVGREVTLDIERLRDPRPDGLYELWFVAPGDTRRRPDRVSAGTFHPDEQGRGTVRLLAAADPQRYPRVSVTLQPSDGDPRRIGPEVLRP